MVKWLARFSFTFLVLAGLLIWQGYRELTVTSSPNIWRIGLYFIGAGVSVGLAFRGIRERHRRSDDF
jgi:hypothetical protein